MQQVADAKTLWGARRKKDEDDTPADNSFTYRKGKPAVEKKDHGHSAKSISQNAQASKPKIVEQMTAKRIAKKQSSDLPMLFVFVLHFQLELNF